MDRREAIDVIRLMKHQLDRDVTIYDGFLFEALTQVIEKQHEALDLAIEALSDMSEEEVDYCNNCSYISYNGDCISREDAIEAIADIEVINHDQLNIREGAVFMLEQLPPVNQKQITGKLENDENATSESEESTMNQPKSKLESDLISRQAAIDVIAKGWELFDGIAENKNMKHGYIKGHDNAITLIKSLPSVTPTERTGEWLDTEFLKLKECSCCHCRWGMYDVEDFDFCPNCGAKMKGGTENE